MERYGRQPTNADVADTLDRYGTLLELSGESPFRVRAYRRAADAIRYLPEPIVLVHDEDRLREIPGVGEGIAAAVAELLESGRYRPLVEISQHVPLTLLDLLALPGVGVKTVTRLHHQLGITDLDSLEAAALAGRFRDTPGFGKKLESTVLAGLDALRRRTGRIPLGTALPAARNLVATIQRALPTANVAIAGSTRRMEETVADIDVVVGVDNRDSALDALTTLPLVANVVSRAGDGLRIKLQSGIEADLFVPPPGSFGTALLRATGSANHLGLLNANLPEAETEEAVYRLLGLPWIPPELRQGSDELSRLGEIPQLVTLADVNGEFHCHTTWSDGSASVADMAAAAVRRGYRFLGISDHSQGLAVANGLDPSRLAAQRPEIEQAARQHDIRLLASAEVEVGRDGNLDLPDQVLARLDVVIASLHVGLRRPREELMERLVGVLHNRHVDILAHPSGRLIERREGGDFDWDRAFATAAQTGTALEINADPARLDLNDTMARRALESGCLLTVNCDAHHPSGFGLLEYGIAVARRAWARPDQILNCWPIEQIEAWLGEHGR